MNYDGIKLYNYMYCVLPNSREYKLKLVRQIFVYKYHVLCNRMVYYNYYKRVILILNFRRTHLKLRKLFKPNY